MLRVMMIALPLAMFATGALAEPKAPAPQQFSRSGIDMPVVADDGTVQGRVRHVQRNARGDVVSASVEGLEAPADAPRPVVVASSEARRILASDRRVSSVPAGTFSR